MKNELPKRLQAVFTALIVIGLFTPMALGVLVWAFVPYRIEHRVAEVPSSGLGTSTVDIHGREVLVELAVTPQQWETGLSYRDFMPEDRGMLFVFPEPTLQTFWMHGMRIPLDMVFVNRGTVIQIESDVPPPQGIPPRIIRSIGPADMVLELHAGAASSLGIQVGDILELPGTSTWKDALPTFP